MKLQGDEEAIFRKQREIEYHHKMASSIIDAWGWGTPAGKRRVTRRLQMIQSQAHLHQGLRVLEIGCGMGIFSQLFVQTGIHLTAIDLSEDLLEQAKKNVPNVEFLRQDAEHLIFPEKSFDVVLGISILHHLNLKKALSEIYRVLKPGGSIVFSEPNMLNPQIFFERNVPAIRRWAKNTPDEMAFIKWMLANEIKLGGFQNVKVTPFDFLHPSTPEGMIPFIEKLSLMIERTPLIKEIAGSLLISAQRGNE